MYPLETREPAVEAVAAGFSLTEAAELAGCSRTAVVNWRRRRASPRRPARRPYTCPSTGRWSSSRGWRPGSGPPTSPPRPASPPLPSPAGAGGSARKGALSLMTDSDIAARAPEPREAPSELEELRARCEELELRNAVLEGTIDILKKDPGADLSALTAAERAALADRLRGRFGLRAALAALSLPRSTFYDRLAAASAPDPYAALRPLVRAAFEASGGAYGYRRVRAELARGAGAPQRARGAAGLDPARPVAVSEKVVRRIMAEEGLRARAPRAGPLQLLRRRGGPRGGAQPAAGRRRPRPARLLGRRPRRGSWSPTSPSSGCPTTREGVPLAGRRPVRRRRRRLLGGHLAVPSARGRDARRRRGRRRGRLHAPQRPRLALPHPRLGPRLRGGRGGEVDVAQGALAGQRRLRGVLRQAQGRVLPREGLARGLRRAVRRRARRVDPLVPGGEAEGVRRGRAQGVRYDSRPQEAAGAGRLGRPEKRPHPLLARRLSIFVAKACSAVAKAQVGDLGRADASSEWGRFVPERGFVAKNGGFACTGVHGRG